jgi:putative membrane protein
METLSLSLMGLPAFAMYMATGVAYMIAFMVIYSKITPHSEWSLMMNGNQAAAFAYGGSILGFTLPLYSAMTHSVNLIDFAIWALVALVVQLVAFFGLRMCLSIFSPAGNPSLCKHIEEDHKAYGILAGAVFLSIGLLNAASMTY